MSEVIGLIIKWFIPVACSGMLAFIVKQLKFNKAMKESQLAIIRSQLISKCEKYLDMGYCPEYTRYCLEELFKSYKTMGGNHSTEIIVEKTLNLPLRKKGGLNYGFGSNN